MHLDVFPLSDADDANYQITVYPNDGEAFPALPKLSKGDFFEDASGAWFEILAACQAENQVRTDEKVTYTYHWRYLAAPVDPRW